MGVLDRFLNAMKLNDNDGLMTMTFWMTKW